MKWAFLLLLILASPAACASALPEEHQIPARLLPAAREQRQRNSCSFISVLEAVESHYLARAPGLLTSRLSVECLLDLRNWMFDQGAQYSGSDKPVFRPDPNGEYPASLVGTITGHGVPLEGKYGSVDCTYDGDNFEGGLLNLDGYEGLFNRSFAFGKGLAFEIDNAPTIDSIKTKLAADVPVVVGVYLFESFTGKTSWLFDPAVDTYNTGAGGHVVLLTGYRAAGDQTFFTFENSWGQGWGSNGFGTLNDLLLTNTWRMDPTYDFTVSVRQKQ